MVSFIDENRHKVIQYALPLFPNTLSVPNTPGINSMLYVRFQYEYTSPYIQFVFSPPRSTYPRKGGSNSTRKQGGYQLGHVFQVYIYISVRWSPYPPALPHSHFDQYKYTANIIVYLEPCMLVSKVLRLVFMLGCNRLSL